MRVVRLAIGDRRLASARYKIASLRPSEWPRQNANIHLNLSDFFWSVRGDRGNELRRWRWSKVDRCSGGNLFQSSEGRCEAVERLRVRRKVFKIWCTCPIWRHLNSPWQPTFQRMPSLDPRPSSPPDLRPSGKAEVLKRHSPHGAAFWRLDDDACGPDWTKTFLADLFNTVEKRCHYHWLFLTWVRGHDEIFTPSLPRRGSLRKHCSTGAPMSAMIAIFFGCSGFISSTSDEQAMQGSAWSSLAKLWVRWLVRIFPLPWLDRRQSGMTLWMLFLCARVSAQCAGQSTSEALRQWPFPLHIAYYRPLLLLLSVLAAPKKRICGGGRSSGTWSQFLCRSARWPASAGTVALRTTTFQLARGPHFEQWQVSIPVLNVFSGVTNLPEVESVRPRWASAALFQSER